MGTAGDKIKSYGQKNTRAKDAVHSATRSETDRGILVPDGLLRVKLGLLEGKFACLGRPHDAQQLYRGGEKRRGAGETSSP